MVRGKEKMTECSVLLPLSMNEWTSGSILNDINCLIDRSCDVITFPNRACLAVQLVHSVHGVFSPSGVSCVMNAHVAF